MSAATDHRGDDYFLNEMTGVLRNHRARGTASAMHVIVITRVRELGEPVILTFHHVGPRTVRRPRRERLIRVARPSSGSARAAGRAANVMVAALATTP